MLLYLFSTIPDKVSFPILVVAKLRFGLCVEVNVSERFLLNETRNAFCIYSYVMFMHAEYKYKLCYEELKSNHKVVTKYITV